MIDKMISFVEALLLHGVLFAVIILNLELPVLAPLKSIQIPSEKVIEAIAIDEQQLVVAVKQQQLAQVQQMQQLEQTYAHLKQQQREIERTTKREHQQLEKLQRQKARQQKKIERLQQKRWAAAAKIDELQRKKAEKLRLKRKAEARRREESRKAEERKRAEKRQEQARRQAVAKREQERKRAAAREKQRKLAQERAARQASAGKKAQTQQPASSTASTQNRLQRVMKNIQKQVQSHWIRPRGHYQGLSCTIDIFLYRNGSVKRATITKGSGHRIFDNSALRAVHQASPLPIPADLFEHFRHFRFQFKP